MLLLHHNSLVLRAHGLQWNVTTRACLDYVLLYTFIHHILGETTQKAHKYIPRDTWSSIHVHDIHLLQQIKK